MSTLPSAPPYIFPRLHAASSASARFSHTHPHETTAPSSDPAPVLPLYLFGLFAAFATAWLVCKVPAAFMYTWTAFFLRSFAYVLGVIAAGIAGTQILWFLLSDKSSLNFRSLFFSFACSWAFLPSIVFFYREHSPWMLAATPLTAAITALSLKRLRTNSTEASAEPDPTPATQTNAIPSFSAISTPNRSLWWIVAIAAAAQASILLWLLDQDTAACLILSLPAFVTTWQGSASARKPTTPYPQLILALFFTALALLPWLNTPLAVHLSHILRSDKTPFSTTSRLRLASEASSFTSIVLWPPRPKEKAKVVPPKPNRPSLGQQLTATAKPLVIPFDGPYWYFQPPDTRPAPSAHIMHGKPTVVNMHSTNMYPLEMQARQNLGTFINSSCCREIDVTLTNADNRPGSIGVSLLLTDTSSPTPISQTLAPQPILSSLPQHFTLHRAPVQETLRFQLTPGKLRRFNQITVVFLPDIDRSLGGAKVAIQDFTLVPR